MIARRLGARSAHRILQTYGAVGIQDRGRGRGRGGGVSQLAALRALASLALQLLRTLPCSQMEAPPHALHWLRRLPWSQMEAPPHSFKNNSREDREA